MLNKTTENRYNVMAIRLEQNPPNRGLKEVVLNDFGEIGSSQTQSNYRTVGDIEI
jgi:hypothetical protein